MRYIRYKTEKQQINFLNCNDIDEWIDTCHTRDTEFIDVCLGDCECGSTSGSGSTSGDTSGSTSGSTTGSTTGSTSRATIITTFRGNGSKSVKFRDSLNKVPFDKLLIDGELANTGWTSYVFDDFEIHTVEFVGIATSEFFENSDILTAVILDGLTSIGNSAFYNCQMLTSVVIPNSVMSIGRFAFSNCPSLTSVNIGNGVTSIDNYAFDGCKSLTSIVIPDSVTTIGDWTFSYCSGLTSVTIGSGVTDIGIRAFTNCSSLSSITCLATTAPGIGSRIFDGLPTNGTLHVPSGSDYSSWLNILGSGWTIEYL